MKTRIFDCLRILTYLSLILIPAGCCNPEANINYFPEGGRAYFVEALRKMKEPSLYEINAAGTEQYRFLWLRSFDEPIAIRVYKESSVAKLRVVRLNFRGNDMGRIDYDKSLSLTEEEWKRFLNLLNGTSFWAMPTRERTLGLDGADWVLEGRSNSQYHLVVRWSPDWHIEERHLGTYREVCLYLLELSKIAIPKEKSY